MKHCFCYKSMLVISISSIVIGADVVINIPDLGAIKGLVNSFVDSPSTSYYQFRGVPYAEAPRRFQLSRAKRPWKGILDATAEGNICPQPWPNHPQSEDCLFISVTTPTNPNAVETLSPVLVFVHGGGYTRGNSRTSLYDPQLLVEDGIVVVQMNYRLGALGWMTDGAIIPKNIGLKDVRLALTWVQDYIIFFGGDPSQVTLNGQSAGSAIVAALWQSPRIDGLFRRVFAQSGTSVTPWAVQKRPQRAFKVIVGFTQSCEHTLNATVRDQVTCMRSASFDELSNAVVAHTANFVTYGLTNGFRSAVVVEDARDPDAIVVRNPLEQLDEGDFRTDVPLLVSITSEEMLTFAELMTSAGNTSNAELVPTGMLADDPNSVGGSIKAEYAGSEALWAAAPLATFVSCGSDLSFNFPHRRFIELIQPGLGPTPVFALQFGYASAMGRRNDGVDEVGHSDDLIYAWIQEDLTQESAVGPTYPPETFHKRRQYVRLITNFVKFGNPTPAPEDLLNNITWPLISDIETFEYLDFGRFLTILNRPKNDYYSFWSNLYQQHGSGEVSL